MDAGAGGTAIAGVLPRIFEELPFGVVVIDRETRTAKFANARWCEMAGMPPDTGRTIHEVATGFQFLKSDGTPCSYDEMAVPVALRTGRRTERGDFILRRPDGVQLPVMVTALPVDLAGRGEFDAVIAVVQDRRDMARAFEEEQAWQEGFESAVESNRQVVYDFDRLRGRVRWSRSVQAVLGYDRETMMHDTYLGQRIAHPEDRPLIEAVFAMSRSGHRPEFELEYRMQHADGRWLFIHDRGRVTYDDEGRIVRILGTLVDVTAERERDRQLEHTQRLETVGTLAGGIAHDFNNQLTALIGHLDLLAEQLEGHAAAAHLPPARLAAQRCADLTRSLLAFSRKMAPEMRVVSPGAVVQEALMFAARSLPASVRISTELDPEPWPVEADVGQVEQVLLNLFVNARDAMDGAGEMHVTLRNVNVDAGRARNHPGARRGDFVEIAVGDSGGGIAPAVMARLFEPFFTTKGVGRGTGLGLAMAYGIVQSHHGWIEVESVPGERTWFRVLLPRTSGAPAAAGAPGGPGRAAGTGTILVVDDEPLVRDLMANALTAAGYSVLTAANGAIALDLFEAHSVRMVAAVVDLTMPDLSGVAVMDAILARRPGFPVLLASGYGPDSMPEAAGRAAGLLSKPFGAGVLTTAVREVIDRAAAAGHSPGASGQAANGR